MPLKAQRLRSEEYAENFSDIHPPLTDTRAQVESNRCLYCYDAPCTKACPTSIDVPHFIKQISSGNIKGSAHTILSANIMGAGCARVCPTEKLCEGACVLNGLHHEPIPIGLLQRHATDAALRNNWKLFERKPSIGKKVAVVGAGPAGLACAHALSCEGVDVTIFEKEQKSGGLMTYGIAAYKVTPEFCKDETDFILNIGGIDVKYGQALGKDISLEKLEQEYDAVFLAMGLGNTRRLDIPGEELAGVADAISFIYDIRTKSSAEVAVGEKVAVIGMGMTAIDAATQSKRLGAREVTMVYRRTKNEMPCTQKEFDLAMLDGCQVVWLAAPKKIEGKDGKVAALVCDEMTLGKPDASGRRAPEPTGKTITLDVDMVIKATGQIPFGGLFGKVALENKGGKITVNAMRQTSRPKIFAGGDCVNGGAEVVNAVQDGKDAAKGILKLVGIPGHGL
ncbi:MAG: NAD(P)-dependent oxidoreductase [Spirochaetes bacterium]|nr:NAD(P)-dependent oxidoreductase [Spirochaetota bacterium]